MSTPNTNTATGQEPASVRPITRESFLEGMWRDTGLVRRSFALGEERLTPAQWVGLLNVNGPWLGPCCAEISEARDILGRVLRHGETINVADAWDLCATAGTHDGLCELFRRAATADGTADGTTSTNYHDREGSPWPLIVRICRSALGDAAYNAACRIPAISGVGL